MELTREMLEDMKNCRAKSCSNCKCDDFCDDGRLDAHVEKLATALLAEIDKPKENVWTDAPEWATETYRLYKNDKGNMMTTNSVFRSLPKSRIDLIAEKHADAWDLKHDSFEKTRTFNAIKQAILEAMEGEK